MTSQAWWPGIEARDPAGGDPAALASLVAFLGQVADGATSAVRQLDGAEHAMTELVWSGSAAHAFRAHLSTLTPRLRLVATSYRRAADALNDYLRGPNGLVDAQHRARAAEARALRARENLELFAARRRGAADALETAQRAGDAPAAAQWQHIVASCDGEISAFGRAIGQARDECEAIGRNVEQQARAAAAALDDASRSGDYRSRIGWFERHVVPMLAATSKVAAVISAVAGLLSIATLWCPALSGAFATISLVSGLVAALCDVVVQSAAPSRGKGWRTIGEETAATAAGGAAKVFRSVSLAGRTRNGKLVNSFAGLPAGTRLNAGRELRRSHLPTMDRAAATVGLGARGRTLTYRGSALPRQPAVAGARRFARESRAELGALRPSVGWQKVKLAWFDRRRYDGVAFPRASYNTWAVLDGTSTAATVYPFAGAIDSRIRRTPPLRAATASG